MAADRHDLTNHRPLGLLEGVGDTALA